MGKFIRKVGHLMLLGILLTIVIVGIYNLFKTKEIDKAVLTPFSRSVPVNIEDSCVYESEIEYYHYTSPDVVRNNKFGLYIYPDNEKFIDLADQLVNSTGGDWGYVLVPYNVQDTDEAKWSRVFYLLGKRHLIPVVQLWNIDPVKYKEGTEDAAEFLDGFIWPTKTRYISVYNEPNDAAFWYGYVDPGEYARILDFTIDTFKETNDNFYVMNGALNSSAPTTSSYMDSELFMYKMNEEVPGIFNKLDGWASHSYPQPNFSGSPYDIGRWSIKAYESELRFLKEALNVKKELPVFITETGWAHDAGDNYDPSFLSVKKVAENMKIAYEEVWLKDDRVQAVMPFTVWYASPGDHFAWVTGDYIPYEHFNVVKEIPKIEGNPSHLTSDFISTISCNPVE